MAEPVTFDLGVVSTEEARKLRTIRRAWGVVSAVSLLIAVWFLALGLTPGNFSDATQRLVVLGVEGGSLFAVGLCAFALWKTGSGAIGVSIDDTGIGLVWRSGRREHLGWVALGTGFVLLDYTMNTFVAANSRNLWEMRCWNRPPTSLTKDAFAAIVAAAKRNGFTPGTEHHPASFFGWDECEVTRILPRSRL